jgi:nitronate monooxygenase
MWTKSRVSTSLGIRYPIIQGPFGGGLSTVELVVAVSNAGGLGSFGMHHLNAQEIKNTTGQIKQRTSQPFAANLWIPLKSEQDYQIDQTEFKANIARIKPYLDELNLPIPNLPESFGQDFSAQIEAILEAKPPVLSFVFGSPSENILQELKSRGIRTIGAATTVEEALALEKAGIDLIVASGSDAGGHRPSFLKPAQESLVGTFSLIPQVVDAVQIPVIAAGGIADGRGIAAALTLGAQAAQLGTVFLATHESAASEIHKAKLISPEARDTALTRAFSGRYARGVRNRFMQEMSVFETEFPQYPIQNWFMQSIRQTAAKRNQAEYLALWAGQAASLSCRQSALECFNSLVSQTNQILGQTQAILT